MFWPLLVDLGLIGLIVFAVWRGYRDGLLSACANLLGLVASLWVAFTFYSSASGLVLHIWNLPHGLANIMAFFLLAVLTDALVSLLILIAVHYAGPKMSGLQWWHVAGLFPGLINGIITAGYLSSLVLALPLDNPLKVSVRDSHVGPMTAAVVDRLGAPVDQLVQPALNDLSQLFTVEPDSKELVNLPFKVQNPTLCADAEDQMLVLVNKERTSRGIGALTMDGPLQQVGRAHVLDMWQRGYFSHYTPEGKDPFARMDEAGIQYQTAGENLALAPTLDAAHTGLMNSPGHKRNILDPNFHRVGIGCYQSSRYGMMFAQEFTN